MKRYDASNSILDELIEKMNDVAQQQGQQTEEVSPVPSAGDAGKQNAGALPVPGQTGSTAGNPMGIQTPVLDYSIRKPVVDATVGSPQRVWPVVHRPIDYEARIADTRKQIAELEAKQKEEQRAEMLAEQGRKDTGVEKEQPMVDAKPNASTPKGGASSGYLYSSTPNNAQPVSTPAGGASTGYFYGGSGGREAVGEMAVGGASTTYLIGGTPGATGIPVGAAQQLRQQKQQEETYSGTGQALLDARRRLTLLERAQKKHTMESVSGNEDFAQFSGYRAGSGKDAAYDYINATEEQRAEMLAEQGRKDTGVEKEQPMVDAKPNASTPKGGASSGYLYNSTPNNAQPVSTPAGGASTGYFYGGSGGREAVGEMAVGGASTNYKSGGVPKRSKELQEMVERDYHMMKPEEIAIYNYHYNKYGPEQAQEYLDTLEETLNERRAKKIFHNMRGNTAMEILSQLATGFWEHGINVGYNFNSDDYIPTTTDEYLSEMIRKDLKTAGPKLPEWMGGASFGQVAGDLAYTTGNMLPAMAMNYIVPGSGMVSMGLSASGNAYRSMLNEGYSKGQARAYSIMVGAAEVGMEKLWNAIPQLGKGALPETALRNLSKLDNALGNFAKSRKGQWVISVLSEGGEEGLQELLEPMIKAAVTSEELDIDWDNVVYSTFLGGLSGGTFEGFDILFNPNRRAGAGVQDGKAEVSGEPGLNAAKKGNPIMELMEGFDIPKSEAPVKTEEQQQLDAAMKEILGVENGGIDTETTVDYNNIIKNEGENYGQRIDDRTAGVGDSAQGMAGVQPGDRPSVERGQEHGGVAGNSGVLRLSTELQNAREKRGLPSFDLYDTSATPQEYERALVAGRNSDAVNGWCVTPKSAQELAEGNVRTAMNADHTVGVGVAPDGDIVAVFKNRNGGPRKALDTAMPVAIEMGGDRLDCYGEGLVRVYEGYGFIPVARVEFNPEYANDGWTPDKGQPYIYVMMHNGDSAATVTEKMHSYKLSTQAELDALPTYGKDAYDEAMRYRDQMMQGRKKNADDSGMTGAAKGKDESVGAATRGFTGKEGYNDLLTDENSQPDRPGDVRPMEVLKTDPYGRRVSETAANAYGAEVTPDSMADTIQELIYEGALGFDTRTNQESLEAAAKAIEKKGMAATERAITKAVADGKVQDGDIEKAMILYAQYANRKSQQAQERAAELMVDLATMANMTGRNLQLFKMLRKMTPEGQLMTVKKETQRAVEKMQSSGKVKKDFTPEIDPKLEQNYLDAAKELQRVEEEIKQNSRKKPEDAQGVTEQTDAENARQKAKEKLEDTQQAIYQTVAAQMPATFRAKWDAWRYMAMLGNVKTQARNIVGNLAFRPYVEVKRALGAAVEKMFVKKENRTKALMGPGKADRALLNWAKADAKTTAADALKYSAKLGDDASASKIRDGAKVFDSKLLEGFRKLSEAAPAKADLVFKNWEYSKSLAGFLKARGFTAEDIQAGKVDGGVLEEARNYAIQEAMKATFNDANAFSDFVSMRFREDNAFKTAANIAMDGVLPFRRTPANILVRMKEYSPVEIGRGVWNLAANVKNGKVSAATAIDQIASGVTGTGAMVLGWAMANGLFGIRLRGSDVSDEEKEQGHQPYSLEFSIDGELHSYKIDWCAPANLPLFIGANICDSVRNGGGDTNLSGFTSTVYAMGHAFEPMLSLSCLSSLNDLFQAGRYAGEGDAIYSVLSTMATSYITQGIPALLRQADQAAQENEMVTFANHEDPLIRGMQRTAANIPFVGRALGLKVDKVNEDGETVSRGNIFERVANAFVNPGTHKRINTDEVDEERQRLTEELGENVRVPDVPKTITYTDSDGVKHENYRLTGEEYTTFQQVQGQTQNRILGEIVESDNYEALTDELKAKVFGYVYDYARESGRMEAIEGYPGFKDSWMEGIGGNEADAIVQKVVKGTFDDAFSGMTECWKNGRDDSASVEALEEAYQVYKGLDRKTRKKLVEDSGGRLEAYFSARENGIDTETFAKYYEKYYEIDNADLKESEKAAKWSYELQRAVERGKLDEDEEKVLRESLKFYNMFPADTAKFDQLTDAGIDSEDAWEIGELLDGLEPEKGRTNVRDVQKAEAIVGMDLSRKDTRTALKAYLNDSQDENLDQMLKMGFSAEDYVVAWRLYQDYTSGNGKKQRTIEKYMEEFGVDKKTARAIYEIYG